MDPLSLARAGALRLLKLRPRSEREIEQCLARKGFAPAVVGAVLRELRGKGLVDDARFARFFGMKEMSALEEARALAGYRADRMKGETPRVKARRLAGFLARRGFEEEMVAQVVQETVAGEEDR